MLQRRGFLMGGAAMAAPAFRHSPIAFAIGALSIPKPAQAGWQAALAVVSLVASMIAAANRGDGGMGAMFKASLDYQRTMAAQLLSLQEAMTAALIKLNALDDTLRAALYVSRLEELRTSLQEGVSRYIEEATQRGHSYENTGGYEAWIANNLTQRELAAIDEKLRSAVTRIRILNWLDPWTVLLLPVVANVAFAVRKGMGEHDAQLRAEGQRYLNAFQEAESPSQPGSTAAQLVSLQGKLKEQQEVLRTAHGCVLPLDGVDNEVFTALIGVFTVRDYLSPQVIRYDQHCKPGVGPKFDTPPICPKTPVFGKPYYGPFEKYASLGQVTSELLPKDAPPGSLIIRQYSVLPEVLAVPFDATSYSAVVVPNEQLVLDFERAPTKEQRAVVAQDALKGPQGRAEPARKALAAHIDQINITLAKMALCIGALTTSTKARNDIYKAFGVSA